MSSPALSEMEGRLPDVDTLVRDLDAAGYLTDQPLGVALFLAARMGQPILLEGEPVVGKAEAAKALATVLDTRPSHWPGRWPRASRGCGTWT
jgi:MoxR-like ATPase